MQYMCFRINAYRHLKIGYKLKLVKSNITDDNFKILASFT